MDLRDQSFTFVGINSVIKGDLELSGPTHLCASIHGDIRVEKEFDLTIEPQGEVQGRINCGNINIYGKVNGDITAKGRVKVFPTASVSGKIVAQKINISPGAKVNMQGHTLEN